MAKSPKNGPKIGLVSSTTPYDPVHPNFDAAIVEKSIGKFRPQNHAAAISKSRRKFENNQSEVKPTA